ncbi:porin [Ramlibacter alkalitolerans]|uniref:Porin n=1 Tax=Ramlibacter alkalitolerans TaxID=2039631 RepID=A0ABS1JTF8_9BURK|nr:porin [Ramlibacter alkalitolerans]MBL0427421.1 porin [Ramlibacter alkalitolerans]
MKKSLIALAVMAAAGAASAQSSVTLFGIVDATIAHGRASGTGAANKTALANSGYNSSRIGFRGTEDLGGGMAASFWLEGSLGNDDGTAGQRIPVGNQNVLNGASPTNPNGVGDGAGLVFNRRSTVSLSGGWGEVRLGRDYTPSFWNLTVFDPFGTNGVGTTLTLVGPAGGLGTAGNAMAPVGTRGVIVRASNDIGYFLPANLGGFYGQFNYWLGENTFNGANSARDGTGWGGRLGYGAGPFNVAISYARTAYDATPVNPVQPITTTNTFTGAVAPTAAQIAAQRAGDFRTWNIGGQWDFGVAKVMGHYTREQRDSSAGNAGTGIPASGEIDGRGWLLGTLVPVGAGEIRASYSTYKIDAGAGADPRARQLALGYVHNLSKRTALYATAARVQNRNGAAVSLNGATLGTATSSTGYDLGIRHSF